MELTNQQEYKTLLNQISVTYKDGRERAVQAINNQLVQTNWKIGRYIVEFEQQGADRASYGKKLLEQLAADLTLLYGKGFSRSNLNYMRLLYRYYPICEELPHKLGWTHLCELVKIDDPIERSFYEKQTVLEKWSTTIQYAMHNISSQLFVSKYQLYLPDKEELRTVIEKQLNSN